MTRPDHGALVHDRLLGLDSYLTTLRWPRLSAWWIDTLRAFLTSARRQLVARVGRRGGKSSTLCRLAVAFALTYDVSLIPPGDVGVVAFVSTTRDEASQRLRTIRALLDAMQIAWRAIPDGIELVDRPIAFRVYACTLSSVIGFTSILIVADEAAKWRDADTGANPASEVLASLRPTMATQPLARIVLSSSPVGSDDAHARAMDEGDTDFQLPASAPTWVANPTLSEEDTRRLEPDLRVWAREFAAIPQTAKLGAFDPAHVAAAFVAPAQIGEPEQRFGVIDASSGKRDEFTYGVVGWREVDGKRKLVVEAVDGFSGTDAQTIGSDGVVGRISHVLKEHGAKIVFADQREAFSLAALFTQRDIDFVEIAWTSSSKEQGVALVRRWLADGVLVLPEHSQLRRQLLAFEERITPSGGLAFGARGSGHDDYVALLVTAAMAVISDQITDRSVVIEGATFGGVGSIVAGGSEQRSAGRQIDAFDGTVTLPFFDTHAVPYDAVIAAEIAKYGGYRIQ